MHVVQHAYWRKDAKPYPLPLWGTQSNAAFISTLSFLLYFLTVRRATTE